MASVVDAVENTRRPDIEKTLHLTLFDRLITECHGTRQLIQSIAQKGDSEDLRILDRYVKWNSAIATIERSKILLSDYADAADKAGFAGKTYSRICEMKSDFPDDPAIEVLGQLWRAIKVMNLWETLAGSQAIGLIGRAKECCDSALRVLRDEQVKDPPGLLAWAEEISLKIRKERILILARMQGVDEQSGKTAETRFLDDLESYSPCATLVEMPPQPRLITPKPLMFNLAEDFLTYPSLEKKTSKKGWFKFW
jgi:hypothetical protein